MNVLTDMVTDMNDLDEKPSSAAPHFGAGERAFVYAIARRIVGSPEAAEDVAQDAMLLAYVHRDAFRGDSRFRTWLYRVAATAALGHLRKVKRSREVLNLEDDTLPALPDPKTVARSHRRPQRGGRDREPAPRGPRAGVSRRRVAAQRAHRSRHREAPRDHDRERQGPRPSRTCEAAHRIRTATDPARRLAGECRERRLHARIAELIAAPPAEHHRAVADEDRDVTPHLDPI